MYIISLILAILAFVCAFLPGYGIGATLIIGIISIILAVFNYKGAGEKKIKEVSIISIVVTIISFIICVCINVYAVSKVSELFNSDINYNELVKDYSLYNVGDEIIDEYSKFVITNVSFDGEIVILDADVTFFGDERYFSNYDFYILDITSDEVYFPSYESNKDFLNSVYLGNGEEINGKIKFNLYSNSEEKELYLIYSDGKSNFKIQI